MTIERGQHRAFFIASCVAGLALCLAGYFPIGVTDTFGHLAQGRQIVSLGYVPSHDTFSLWQEAPTRWNNYEWLSDLIGFRVYAFAGFDGLLALKLVVLAITGFLLVLLAYVHGGVRAALCCCVLIVLAVPAVRFRLTERPHLATVPLAALYLVALSYLLRAWGAGRVGVDRAWIAALALLHLLWVNFHGSHLLGLCLTLAHLPAAWLLPGALRRVSALLALQLVASCISPYGPAILIDAVQHLIDPAYTKLVTEWASWDATHPTFYPRALGFLLFLQIACARPLWRRGVAVRPLLALGVGLCLLAFRSLRFIDLAFLLCAPILGIAAGGLLTHVRMSRLLAVVTVTLVVCAAVVPWGAAQLPPHLGMRHGIDLSGLPAASGQWLARHAKRPRIFAGIGDSWYLMFAVPHARFFVDGRVPFYGVKHINQLHLAMKDPLVLGAILERYRIDTVVVPHSYRQSLPLLRSMRGHHDFALVSIEDRYALFMRKDARLASGKRPEPLPLNPGYDAHWLLSASAPTEQSALLALKRLPAHKNANGYRAWVRALLALRPFVRDGGKDGIRSPVNAAEVASLRRVQQWLARVASGTARVPLVYAYQALVATKICDLAAAEDALSLARQESESRETLLGGQEILLRQGEAQQVKAFLRSAESMAGAAGDGWLADLRAQLRMPPACVNGQPSLTR